MSERIINHPLRTIILKYDDAKPETDSDKRLLEAYIAIHDRAAELNKMTAKLSYEYSEWEGGIIEVEKRYSVIAQQIDDFFKDIGAATAQSDNENIKRLEKHMTNYFPEINEFHEGRLNKLSAESDRIK